MPGLVAVAAVAVAGILAVSLPALANREVDRAFDALDAGRLDDAVDAANRAGASTRSRSSRSRRGRWRRMPPVTSAAAVAWYEKATDLQPENPDAWYDLGLYLVDRDARPVRRATRRSTTRTRSTRFEPLGRRAGRSTSRATPSTTAPARAEASAAEDEHGLCAVQLARPDAVERAHDLHAEVACEPRSPRP